MFIKYFYMFNSTGMSLIMIHMGQNIYVIDYGQLGGLP
jgi:hypothetical protein